ncbi:gas vesicle structural protein GvpA [Okeania sp. SIO2B3]|uniref:gas vesicle structural protein GvpA n=1 Tax=Okeania sp. SIO2B3 TaxID=2607784 RepID=UPI0013C11D03|nr:gas vesicle structural protein GvpA [Okeania sp. SIO2B3]NET42894.1 gas vesicle structural protein GvpA [Okeania sp. SIO2B3]
MAVEKVNSSSSLAEVVDRILDKGVVIDAWVRVSLVGIELLAVEARIVIASVETYLKYAEAVGLTALAAAPGTEVVDETEIGQPMASPTLV